MEWHEGDVLSTQDLTPTSAIEQTRHPDLVGEFAPQPEPPTDTSDDHPAPSLWKRRPTFPGMRDTTPSSRECHFSRSQEGSCDYV